MTLQKIKKYIAKLWLKFNLGWARAGEIQNRIDETKLRCIQQQYLSNGKEWRHRRYPED